MLEILIEETMKQILSGDTPILEQLKKQYQQSSILSVEKSDAGCYVNFNINNTVEKTALLDFEIGDVYIKTSKMKYGMGTLLFVRNGFLSMLEYYTYGGDDPMPNEFEDFLFTYGNGQRDFEAYIS